MRNLVPIGRFSQICRLTVAALRLYDELGLLRPALVDPDTGYRYYSLAQAQEAERIRRLRSVEMSLDEIRSLLTDGDPLRARERLEAHRCVLERRLEAARQAIASLDRLIAQEGHEMPYDVTIRECTPQLVLSVRGHTPMRGIAAWIGQAYAELFTQIGRSGARPSGPPFAIYHDQEMREEDVDMEAGVPVSNAVEPTGRARSWTLPAGTVASTLHVGAYEELGNAYAALAEWVQFRGHETAGPPMESYLVGPMEAKDPAELRTEILWPIR